MQAGVAAEDAVIAIGIKIGLKLLVGVYQCPCHFRGMLKVDVVVGHAVYEQVFAAQAVGKVDRRVVFITRWVFLVGAHESLRIDGVVPSPVGHRRYRNGGFEHVGAFENAQRRHVAAVAPSENADAGRVDVRQGAKVFSRLYLVYGFVLAQLLIRHFFELLPPAPGAAVVHAGDDESLLSEHLEPPVVGTFPGVGHLLAARTSVHEHEYGMANAGVKLAGFDHPSVERDSFAGLEIEKLQFAHSEFFLLFTQAGVVLNGPHQAGLPVENSE